MAENARWLNVLAGAGAILAAQGLAAAQSKVVVANRGSGSISVIDVATDSVDATLLLPEAAAKPEPMYVVHLPQLDRVLVGDRANARVVAFHDSTFAVDGEAPAGNGVFHMWAERGSRELWVVNELDFTCSVVDAGSLALLTTVPMPPDLVSQGGKPHDVVVEADAAYVSMIALSGPDDFIVKFDRATRTEVKRLAVRKDPHLALHPQKKRLYVPCQGGNRVLVVGRTSLELITEIDVDGAHGAGMTKVGRLFYTTNLPGGGTRGLVVIDTTKHAVVGSVDTPFTTPHNIAVANDPRKIYVTHSGATADRLTIYTTDATGTQPQFLKDLTLGLNPFGIALVD